MRIVGHVYMYTSIIIYIYIDKIFIWIHGSFDAIGCKNRNCNFDETVRKIGIQRMYVTAQMDVQYRNRKLLYQNDIFLIHFLHINIYRMTNSRIFMKPIE